MSTQNKIREAQEAIGSIYDLSQQLEREGTVAEWWTEANTEAIVKATEALAALSELDAPPSAPTVDQITLEGEQSDPCGTITVKVRMSDGREVEAIRTNANSIYHTVTLADPAFGK